MASMSFTAVTPGLAGNLIVVEMIPVIGGPALSLLVTDLGMNQFTIQISYGVDMAGGPLVDGNTTQDLADLLNSDPAFSALATAVGGLATDNDGLTGIGRMRDGKTGNGL